jgi:hypothetical protein
MLLKVLPLSYLDGSINKDYLWFFILVWQGSEPQNKCEVTLLHRLNLWHSNQDTSGLLDS